MKKLQDFDLLTHYNKRKLCESALHSLGYDPKRIPRTADPGYGHAQLDTSGEADAQDYAQINALMDGHLPPSLGPSSSGTPSAGLSGGFGFPGSSVPPTAKAMPKSSSTTRPCPTSSQGGQANKIRKIVFPMTPTPSHNKYRLLPPISQQACRKACEAIDHGMGQGYSLQDWYVWYLTEELTDEVTENLQGAWFPDSDVIRLAPELTDFPYSPENMIVKAATPDMALNPLYDPHAVPTVPPSGPPSDQSDPWLVPKSLAPHRHPRNRNHKSLAIVNHNFEVASFSRRNRSVAITALGRKNRCDSESHPCSRNVFWGFPDPCGASETL